jgi:hypothetical protein
MAFTESRKRNNSSEMVQFDGASALASYGPKSTSVLCESLSARSSLLAGLSVEINSFPDKTVCFLTPTRSRKCGIDAMPNVLRVQAIVHMSLATRSMLNSFGKRGANKVALDFLQIVNVAHWVICVFQCVVTNSSVRSCRVARLCCKFQISTHDLDDESCLACVGGGARL